MDDFFGPKTAVSRLNAPYGYAEARRFGFSHAQALQLAEKWDDLKGYIAFLEAGATEAEILEARYVGIDGSDYASCRGKFKLTHQQILEIVSLGLSVAKYVTTRTVFKEISHEELIECLKEFGSDGIVSYETLRTFPRRRTHQEVIETLRKRRGENR